MTRRILTVILAIVLAMVGVVAVLAYVKRADQRAIAGQKAVTVLVAAQQIPAGTSAGSALTDGLLTSQKLPAASVPADAVRSIGPALRALVTSASVAPGQLLLRPMLVTSVVSAAGLPIPAGMVALTIPLCVPQAVAGYVYPQAQVAVFDTVFTGSQTGQTSCGGPSQVAGNPAKDRTRIVLPRVTVLAIGTASSAAGATATSTAFSGSTTSNPSSDPGPQGAVLVTLAVRQDDAERLISLVQAGLPWLALLSKSSATGADAPTVPLFPPYK